MPSDDTQAVIHTLIIEGEALQGANGQNPDEDAFVVWIGGVQEILTRTFGHGHRFVVDAGEVAQGASQSGCNDGTLPAGYFRVLTIVALTVLRRAALEAHVNADRRPTLSVGSGQRPPPAPNKHTNYPPLA